MKKNNFSNFIILVLSVVFLCASAVPAYADDVSYPVPVDTYEFLKQNSHPYIGVQHVDGSNSYHISVGGYGLSTRFSVDLHGVYTPKTDDVVDYYLRISNVVRDPATSAPNLVLTSREVTVSSGSVYDQMVSTGIFSAYEIVSGVNVGEGFRLLPQEGSSLLVKISQGWSTSLATSGYVIAPWFAIGPYVSYDISLESVYVNGQMIIGTNPDLSGVRPNTNIFSIPAGSCAIARIPRSAVASDSIYVSTTMSSSRGVLSRSGGQSYYLSDVYFNEFDFGFFGEHGSTPITWTSDGTLFKKSNKYHSYIDDVNGFAYIYLSNPTTLDGSSDVNGSMYVSATFPFDWVKLKTFDDNPYSYTVYTESSPTFDSYSVYDSDGNQTALGWQESTITGASVVVPTSSDSTVINNYYGGQYSSNPQQFVTYDSSSSDSMIGQIVQFFTGKEESIQNVSSAGGGFFSGMREIFSWLPNELMILIGSFLTILLIVGVVKMFL